MSGKPTIARVALAEQVTSLLEERILDRFYRPGERLNIDALSRAVRAARARAAIAA